jgi:hypothetical protein
MKIRFQQDWASGTWNVFAFDRRGRDRILYRVTLESVTVPENEAAQPSFKLDIDRQTDFVGALLEGLSEAGLIPKMGATEAELTATKKHLEDMRAMAFEEVKPAARLS